MIDLTPAQAEFIECVCRLRPRVAAFDCDGTLWSGDAGEGFFSWTMKHGLVSSEMEHWARARYAEYRAGNVAEEVMCGEMVTMYRNTREADIQKATDEYFELGIAPGIFPEMRELVRRLLAGGTDVWAVSSSNEWII